MLSTNKVNANKVVLSDSLNTNFTTARRHNNHSNHNNHPVEGESDLHTFMRIVLDDMPEDPDPVKPGSQGTVVDYDEYQILVDWDEDVGRSLHLIPGVDKYHVLNVDNSEELEKSWLNLAVIQDKLRDRDGDSEKKQSRSKRRLIGKIDKETGEIVPTGKRGRKKSSSCGIF